jgi:hypothetical protein
MPHMIILWLAPFQSWQSKFSVSEWSLKHVYQAEWKLCSQNTCFNLIVTKKTLLTGNVKTRSFHNYMWKKWYGLHLWSTSHTVTSTRRNSKISLPDRESKIPRVTPTGTSKEAAIEPTLHQQDLCFDAWDIGMKPSGRTIDHYWNSLEPWSHHCFQSMMATVVKYGSNLTFTVLYTTCNW